MTNNQEIALQLAGKGVPYKVPDKLLFIDTLQELNPKEFSDEKLSRLCWFGIINEVEFYLTMLNKIERDFGTVCLKEFLTKINYKL